MVTQFLIKYWELIFIGLLIADIIVQKTPWKGDDDILAMIKKGIVSLFTSKPGVLPMLFIGFLLTSLIWTGLAFAGSNVTLQWEGNMAYENVTHYNVYRSTDQATWVKANIKPIPDIGENVTHEWTDIDLSDGTHYWYATAVNNYDRESDPSIILSATFGQPSPPRNFIIKIIEWVISWLKGIFGGSFRLA